MVDGRKKSGAAGRRAPRIGDVGRRPRKKGKKLTVSIRIRDSRGRIFNNDLLFRFPCPNPCTTDPDTCLELPGFVFRRTRGELTSKIRWCPYLPDLGVETKNFSETFMRLLQERAPDGPDAGPEAHRLYGVTMTVHDQWLAFVLSRLRSRRFSGVFRAFVKNIGPPTLASVRAGSGGASKLADEEVTAIIDLFKPAAERFLTVFERAMTAMAQSSAKQSTAGTSKPSSPA
ncbi:MAG: hypothetical protein LBR22_08880 [Desulfovibrio sp.]|jgi:hypothetical protein|nr:hypothetical protein [Desulfovibrio sp.]